MIENIKIGIKIATRNFNFLPDIYANQNLIDFIEIILMPEFASHDIEILKNLKMPYAIHLPGVVYGIDFGDIKKNHNNLSYIEKINQHQGSLNPICYIVHPESGNVHTSINNLKKLKIKPLALENMPMKGIFGGELLAYEPHSMKIFFDAIKDLEFCFDINHAIKASVSKKIDYIQFIKDFLKFKTPIIYHISQGDRNIEIDDHLPLYKGNYNLHKIKSILLDCNSIVYLTIETPRDINKKIEDDLRNIKIFLEC